MIEINAKKFLSFLRKITLNYSISSIHMHISPDRLSSKMMSAENSIAIVDITNDEVIKTDKEYDFYFLEPNIQLIPFLNLFNDEIIKAEVGEEKIRLVSGNQKANVHFCSPEIVSIFTRSKPKENITYFQSFQTDDSFMEIFKKIRKIGNKFGKIYFGNDNKKFYIESTDRTGGRFTNSMRFDIVETIEKDLTMAFKFKNILDLFIPIDDDHMLYTMNFSWFDDDELGLINLSRNENNNSENYYLMSINEGRI